MTNDEIEAIYKENLPNGHITALRILFTHGVLAGQGVTPTATSKDVSAVTAKPAAIIRAGRRIDS